MPVHKLKRVIPPKLLLLRSELEAEWKHPDPNVATPIIYESEPVGDGPIDLYVVWHRWQDVPPHVRTDIILDAFEAVRGREAVMRVSVALGLTSQEAKQSGITLEEDQGP